MVTKKEFMVKVGMFTWDYGMQFFIQTDVGNYVWNDPDYNGDDTIIRFNGDYDQWLKQSGINFGRDKGSHIIEDYCGNQFRFKDYEHYEV